jgi:hypothetical protein
MTQLGIAACFSTGRRASSGLVRGGLANRKKTTVGVYMGAVHWGNRAKVGEAGRG